MVYSFVTLPGTGASPLWVTSLFPGFIFQFDLKNKLKNFFSISVSIINPVANTLILSKLFYSL